MTSLRTAAIRFFAFRLSSVGILMLGLSVFVLAGCPEDGTVDPAGDSDPDNSESYVPDDAAEVLEGDVENAGMPIGTPTEPVLFTAAETVEMEIPGMHCPYGCYPTVEKTLAGIDGVKAVSLADPDDAKDGSIEDRRVFITLDDDFNATEAAEKLAEAGFKPKSASAVAKADEDAEVVEEVEAAKS